MGIITIPPPERESPPPELRLGGDSRTLLDGGMSLKYDPSQLRDNQSPWMPNMGFFFGEVSKRPGQAYVYPISLGAGGFNAAFGRLYKGFKVFAWGTFLYSQVAAAQPVQIMSGLANSKGTFFTFNGILFYLNGTNFVQWDGVAAAATNVVGYIPMLTIGRAPTGGGTVYEALNYIQPGFKDSFSADGVATTYQLSQTNLDATLVTLTVNGVAKTEGTHFTVDRPNGRVNFAAGTAPTGVIAGGVPNNVVITAYKTQAGYANRIKNCVYAIDYGGENDTRVFGAGNPNFPNRLFRTGVGDATYWPDNGYQDVGSNFEPINGLSKHFDKLITLKENSLFVSVYSNTAYQGFWGSAQQTVTFPTFPLNSAVGCDCPWSVQIIDNNVVFNNSRLGPMIIRSTQLKDERVVEPIGGNIIGAPARPGLLDLPKADLQNATSVDFDGRYYLCVGNVAYVWDYRLRPYKGNDEVISWYWWRNINAACFIQVDKQLYYGDRTIGKLVAFSPNYNDFGAAIDGAWRSKTWSFGRLDWLKTILKMWFTTRATSYSSITIKYMDERGTVIDSDTVDTVSFSWAKATWDTWTWAVYQYAPTIEKKPKVKKVIYFQVEFSNNVVNQNLSLLSLIIQYFLVKKVK